jgi:uncharacterized protein (TIGR02246 family)
MTIARMLGAWLASGMLISAPGYAETTAGTAVRESMQRLGDAWNASNAEAWSNEYWPDGELINIRGDVLSGPSQIRDQTAKILAGPFKGSHFAFTVRNMRTIGSDVVIADTDILVTGFRGLPPGITASGSGELRTRMKYVYERRDGSWRIIASQNTMVVSSVSN